MYYLGFDIGGSSIKAVLVKDKKILASDIRTRPDNFDALISLIVETAYELTKKADTDKILGVGFSFAGALDVNRQMMLKSPNIPYLDGQPLKDILGEKLYPSSVKIEHDANCFLLAEKEFGGAKNFKNVFYLTIGTGVGSAWMVDGKIQTGAHGASGEKGHEIINISGGAEFDELEELAAGKFIMHELALSAIEAGKMAQAGDQKAIAVLNKLGNNLGVGIANAINAFDPEVVIIGGGVAEAKTFIIGGIKVSVAKYVVSPAARQVPIIFSDLGIFGGALGATLLFG